MTTLARLTPPECAAVFVMLLDDDQAAGLLGRLPPDQLERVGAIMCELGDIEPTRIADAIAGFVAEAEADTLPGVNRAEKVGTLLNRAVGDVKGGHLMHRILPDAAPKSIEIARWLAPHILVSLIEEEHPQVVAVLLLLLEAEDGAKVLAALPKDVQPRVGRTDRASGPGSGRGHRHARRIVERAHHSPLRQRRAQGRRGARCCQYD